MGARYPVKGFERLKDRGIISKQGYADLETILGAVPIVPSEEWDAICDVRIQWLARILSEMADEVCDLLDRQDQIEGQMDNPEYPDVEERMTKNLEKTKREEI